MNARLLAFVWSGAALAAGATGLNVTAVGDEISVSGAGVEVFACLPRPGTNLCDPASANEFTLSYVGANGGNSDCAVVYLSECHAARVTYIADPVTDTNAVNVMWLIVSGPHVSLRGTGPDPSHVALEGSLARVPSPHLGAAQAVGLAAVS